MPDTQNPQLSIDRNSIICVAAFAVLIYCFLARPGLTVNSRVGAAGSMDSIAVTHAVPKTVTVIHRIEFPDLDAHKVFALQSSLRTLCITTCVVVSISVIAVCKYVVNPAITGRNYREKEKLSRELRRSEKKKLKQREVAGPDESSSSEEEIVGSKVRSL